MSDTDTTASDETTSGLSHEEAMQAAVEELERLIAAAPGDGQLDGPTSETQAPESPEEPLLGDPSTDGSGGSQEGAELAEGLELGGAEDSTEGPEVLTPEQLGESGGSQGALEDQLADMGADTGGDVPDTTGPGGTQPFGQPSVADGAYTLYKEDADGTRTVTKHFGTDSNGTTSSQSVTTSPNGDTTTTFEVKKADGSGTFVEVTRDSDDQVIWTRIINTDDSGRSVSVATDHEGHIMVKETDPDGNLQWTHYDPDGTKTTDADEGFTPSTDDPGPEGSEEVPGGRAEENLEDLEEMAGPTDAGPGNVDPSDHDDGTGGDEVAQGPQPGVDNPPDEQDPPGGGQQIDDSGWATDPSDDDDVGGEQGREESPADALGGQRPDLSPDQVPGVGTTSAAGRSILEELSNPLPDADARARAETAERLTVDEALLSPFVESTGGRGRAGDDVDERLAQAATGGADQSLRERVEGDVNMTDPSGPTGSAGRSIIEELHDPIPDLDARSRNPARADEPPPDPTGEEEKPVADSVEGANEEDYSPEEPVEDSFEPEEPEPADEWEGDPGGGRGAGLDTWEGGQTFEPQLPVQPTRAAPDDDGLID